MKVKEIVEIIKGKLVKGDLEAGVGSFSKDTRTIKVGETYIGIKGENFDGNILWKEAFDKGATTVILQGIEFNEEELEKIQNKNIILVEDTIEALSDIAIHKRNLYGKDFPLIGVTGSVGKTSTKDIIAASGRHRHVALALGVAVAGGKSAVPHTGRQNHALCAELVGTGRVD